MLPNYTLWIGNANSLKQQQNPKPTETILLTIGKTTILKCAPFTLYYDKADLSNNTII